MQRWLQSHGQRRLRFVQGQFAHPAGDDEASAVYHWTDPELCCTVNGTLESFSRYGSDAQWLLAEEVFDGRMVPDTEGGAQRPLAEEVFDGRRAWAADCVPLR